jgi:SAM-dependent methyltransferase
MCAAVKKVFMNNPGYPGSSLMSHKGVDSAAWYDRHTAGYIANTESVDMSDVHARFLAHVPAGGRILDAGCGSGRDSRAMLDRGYDVTPMDASIEMVRHASETLGRPALHLRHQDVDFAAAFDGIWSNASLLHVPQDELAGVMTKYRDALVPGGVMFASFKHGAGEIQRDERLFSNQTAESCRTLLESVPGLDLIEMWVDTDRRPDRGHEEWLNLLCRKTA